MKQLKRFLVGICLTLTAACAAQLPPSQQPGTLIFDLKTYTPDPKMSDNALKTLDHAGIRWGMVGKTVLIPSVNEKFVNADTPYLTRFGERKAIPLAPGKYTITCIGYEFKSTSKDPEKLLQKSGFFNIDVITFTVLPGKTTTLEVIPIYRAESQRRVLVKLTLFLPELNVRVLDENENIESEARAINRRTDKSLAWGDYHGPLKF